MLAASLPDIDRAIMDTLRHGLNVMAQSFKLEGGRRFSL
jgi:hypothetical protein